MPSWAPTLTWQVAPKIALPVTASRQFVSPRRRAHGIMLWPPERDPMRAAASAPTLLVVLPSTPPEDPPEIALELYVERVVRDAGGTDLYRLDITGSDAVIGSPLLGFARSLRGIPRQFGYARKCHRIRGVLEMTAVAKKQADVYGHSHHSE